jgi:hypothetical protein
MIIHSPAFDATLFFPTYQEGIQQSYDPETKQIIEAQVPEQVVGVPPILDIYNAPLLPDYTEITVDEFNDLP